MIHLPASQLLHIIIKTFCIQLLLLSLVLASLRPDLIRPLCRSSCPWPCRVDS